MDKAKLVAYQNNFQKREVTIAHERYTAFIMNSSYFV